MRDAFIARLEALAERDPRVVLITADLGFGVLDRYARRFPRQFLNVGVAEQNMTGIATGMALEGHVVFTYSIGNFPTLRCLEQVRNDAAYHGANVNIVAVGGGFSYGALGFSHHATEDLAILRAIPNLTVLAPGDDWEASEGAEALYRTPGTGYLRLDRASAGDTSREGEAFAIGRSRRLREGSAATLFTTGGGLREVLTAADALCTRHGVACRVESMHTVQPIDADAVRRAVEETPLLVTVEEHVPRGGLGSAILECCADLGRFPERVVRLALPDGFESTIGSQGWARARFGLDAAGIERAVLGALGRAPSEG